MVLAGPLVSAQQNQPIYPVYDGYLKKADGSYTLAFGYFSHNGDTVTIPPGPNGEVVMRARPLPFRRNSRPARG